MFYINLDSRKDRRAKMDSYQTIERVEATTPRDLSSLNVKMDLRSLNNLKFRNKTAHMDLESLSGIACFLSHRGIWQKMLVENIQDAVIFEDDVKINSFDFPEVCNDEPFAWLGLRSEEKITTKDGKLVYDRKVYGAHAYRLHISIVPLLLFHSETLSLSLDFFISELLSIYDIKPKYVQLVEALEFMSANDIKHVKLVYHQENWHLYVIIFLLLAFCIYKTK